MNYLDNPFVWLYRFRHRCGYGVHSPFAYHFLSDVVYERTPYNLYQDLDGSLPLSEHFRVRKILHLLLRISNWWQPDTIVAPDMVERYWDYLHAGCVRAHRRESLSGEGRTVCFLNHPKDGFQKHINADMVLVMDDFRKNRDWFFSLPTVLTFDLYDVGIAFFDPKYNKQDYIVNF